MFPGWKKFGFAGLYPIAPKCIIQETLSDETENIHIQKTSGKVRKAQGMETLDKFICASAELFYDQIRADRNTRTGKSKI